jgi:hypothetical protein
MTQTRSPKKNKSKGSAPSRKRRKTNQSNIEYLPQELQTQEQPLREQQHE